MNPQLSTVNPTIPQQGIWLITFIFSTLVLQWNLPNLGGNHTPQSMFAWATLMLATLWCWLCTWRKQAIYWNKHLSSLFIPPLAVALWGVIGPLGPFENYSLKVSLSLLSGALFVTSLMQLKITKRQWLQLTSVLFAGAIALCLGTLFKFDHLELTSALPVLLTMPYGGFQQPNNYASFLVTVLTFNLWACIRYLAESKTNNSLKHSIYQSFLWIGIFVIAHVVWRLGSRTGYIGMMISVGFLCIWVYQRNKAYFNIIKGAMVAIGLALILAINSDVLSVNDRSWLTSRLIDLPRGASTMARLDIWIVTLSSWWQAPLLGHGLGSFTDVFSPEFNKLVALGHVLSYTNDLTHPHNEVLLWLCETGLLGTALVLGPWLAFLLKRSPNEHWADQIGWWAALVPIALHSMTEYPLHGSGAHWFLLGLIIASRFENLNSSPMTMSRHNWLASFSVIVSSGLLAFVFFIHSGYLSYKMAVHMILTINNPEKYLDKMVNATEMNHPFLGQVARDDFLLNTAPLILTSNKKSYIESTCKQLVDLNRRYRNDTNLEILKKCE
jgi:O-antigen polymerase